jgi:hypothetical protein
VQSPSVYAAQRGTVVELLTSMLRFWRWLTIVLVGVVQGLAYAHVLEKPAKLQYGPQLYVTLQRSLYAWWGPPRITGYLEPVAILATLVLIILLRRHRAALLLTIIAAVALLIAFPVVFFWLVYPVNRVFLSAPPGMVPPNWAALRDQWELGHTIRFALQLFAFGALTASVVIETPPD